MDVCVIGAGNVGRGIIRDMLESDKNFKLNAFDIHEPSLVEAQKLDPERVSIGTLDAGDSNAVSDRVRGSSLVVNTTDGTQCLTILDGAIAAGVNYIDVHGTLLVKERLARHDAASAAGITAMIGMGCSPGATNMLGAYGARNVSGKVCIDVEYVTHRALNPSPGLLETGLRQFYTHIRAPLYEDGVLKEMMPFDGHKVVNFPTIDEDVELVYTPHSEPQTIPLFVKGLSRVSVRGTYHPEMMRLLRALYDFGLLDNDRKVTVDGAEHDFRPLLKQALMGDGKPRPAGLKPKYILRVVVTGEEAGLTRRKEIVIGNPDGWDPLPQGRMTSLPTSFAAQLIARGEFVSPGVCGPELLEDGQVEACLDHLRDRGLWVDIMESTSNR